MFYDPISNGWDKIFPAMVGVDFFQQVESATRLGEKGVSGEIGIALKSSPSRRGGCFVSKQRYRTDTRNWM
jgi:hypothetical protein